MAGGRPRSQRREQRPRHSSAFTAYALASRLFYVTARVRSSLIPFGCVLARVRSPAKRREPVVSVRTLCTRRPPPARMLSFRLL